MRTIRHGQTFDDDWMEDESILAERQAKYEADIAERLAYISANPSVREQWWNVGKTDREIAENDLARIASEEAEAKHYRMLRTMDELEDEP